MSAPDFSEGFPSRGERIGPAWQAMWDAMDDERWWTAAELACVAEPWIVAKTVSGLLQQARKKRLLTVRTVTTDRRRKQYRRPAQR